MECDMNSLFPAAGGAHIFLDESCDVSWMVDASPASADVDWSVST